VSLRLGVFALKPVRVVRGLLRQAGSAVLRYQRPSAVISGSEDLSPLVAPIIDGDQPGLLHFSVGVEKKQGGAFPVTIDRHPPGIAAAARGSGVFCSVGLIRDVDGFPDIVAIRVGGRVGGGDGAEVGAILTVSQINRVSWTLNRGDLRQTDKFRAGRVGWTGERPAIDHKTNQLLLPRVTRLRIWITWTGVNFYFCEVRAVSTAKIRGQHLPPMRTVGARSQPVVIVGIHDQGQSHLVKIVQTLRPLRGRLGFGQRGQQQRRQDGNDRNDNQEFNQREPPGAVVFRLHSHLKRYCGVFSLVAIAGLTGLPPRYRGLALTQLFFAAGWRISFEIQTHPRRNRPGAGAALRLRGGGAGLHPELRHQIPPRPRHRNPRRLSDD
jgi:hypothetical protein